MKVKECMCNEVCCVKPDTKVYEVAKLMKDNQIGAMPVCDNQNNICGIVTDRDILLRCVSCDKDLKQAPISDIMSCHVCTCHEDDDVKSAEKKMADNQIRRIPVCDCDNKVVGIITMGNLAQNDNELGKTEVCDTINNICNCGGQTKNNA